MNDVQQRPWQTVALILGFAFLYTPIVWIIYFSFSGDLPGSGSHSSPHRWEPWRASGSHSWSIFPGARS